MAPRSMLPLIIAAAALATMQGCDGNGDPGAADSFVESDSNGVAVFANRAPAWSEQVAWTVEPRPFITIVGGRQDTDHQLSDVVAALRQADGTIVVADRGSSTLRWYDARGELVAKVGGPGNGPGEFRSMRWVGNTDGDTIVVWDGFARRLSMFAQGAFIREVRPEVPAPSGPIDVHGILRDGRPVAAAIAMPSAAETGVGILRPAVPIWILSRDGAVERTLGEFPDHAIAYRATATPGAISRDVIPLGPTTLIAVGRDRIIIGDNATFGYQGRADDGRLLRIVRLSGTPEPVTKEDLKAELDRRLAGAPPVPEIREGIRVHLEGTPVPATKPFYERILVGPAGHVWLEREAANDALGARWEVISAEGRWLGSVRTPAAFRLTQVGEAFVLGVGVDENGVEDVLAFRLVRPG